MDDRLRALSAQQGGYFTRAQALQHGYLDRHLRAARLDGAIVRIRHGTYVFADLHRTWSEAERHRVVAFSVLDKLGAGVALTHTSAAAVWGCDRWDPGREDVHVTRLDGRTGRRESGVTWHEGAIDPACLVEVDGRLVARPAVAVAQSALVTSTESGIVTASSALRLELCDAGELAEAVRAVARWGGARKAMIVERISDGRCESVGEARSLFMFWRHALPHPEQQFEVFDRSGLYIARTDFAWLAYRHLGEFDGLIKYGRLNPYSTDLGRVLTDEKLREDKVREQSFGLSRWVWADLPGKRAADTANAIRAGLERSKQLYTRNRTHIALS